MPRVVSVVQASRQRFSADSEHKENSPAYFMSGQTKRRRRERPIAQRL